MFVSLQKVSTALVLAAITALAPASAAQARISLDPPAAASVGITASSPARVDGIGIPVTSTDVTSAPLSSSPTASGGGGLSWPIAAIGGLLVLALFVSAALPLARQVSALRFAGRH